VTDDAGPNDRAHADRELVEIVDADGRVIEIITRAEMRTQHQRHRCVYIAVIACDELGDDAKCPPHTELIVHQRADWKDVCPSYWDLAFGGVCGVGESWLLSARRELAEEAGIIDAPLVDCGPVEYSSHETSILGRAYIAFWPRSVRNDDGEVAQFDRVSLDQLAGWVAKRDVCADSAAVMLPLLERLWKPEVG